ncbi:hypothetical protein [Roseateles sp. BYS87W]|uniref:Thioredoxin domain-containing protein n=1 Tax=Pelomonas baiyunensis TaxID=3299026 RepID=A0ABW7GYK9_9BURK
MPTFSRRWFVAALAAAWVGGLASAARAEALEPQAVDRIVALDRDTTLSPAAKESAIRAAFQAFQARHAAALSDLSTASAETLGEWGRLLGFVVYATHHDRALLGPLAQLRQAYARRGMVPPLALRARLVSAWVGFRDFDTARAVAAEMDTPLEDLPPVETAAGAEAAAATVLRVDAEYGVLRREPLSLGDAPHLVVVSFIGCAFSRRAADAIEAHPALRQAMREHSTWIVEPGPLHFSEVRAWNRQHPSTAFTYVDGLAPWAFIDDWATPTFYVVRAGRLLNKFQGWPDDAQGVATLLSALASAGLVMPAPR